MARARGRPAKERKKGEKERKKEKMPCRAAATPTPAPVPTNRGQVETESEVVVGRRVASTDGRTDHGGRYQPLPNRGRGGAGQAGACFACLPAARGPLAGWLAAVENEGTRAARPAPARAGLHAPPTDFPPPHPTPRPRYRPPRCRPAVASGNKSRRPAARSFVTRIPPVISHSGTPRRGRVSVPTPRPVPSRPAVSALAAAGAVRRRPWGRNGKRIRSALASRPTDSVPAPAGARPA